ncbi:MAG: hypothetical protein IJE19_06085 [Clostridia bacterium]|nr:hypothetical protein [Clostridia bacterium]
MKKQYKEIFSQISPDDTLLHSVLHNQKARHAKKYIGLCAACFAVCIAALCVYLANDSETEKSSINIPVAYETKLQPEPQKHIGKTIKKGDGHITIDADVIVEGDINNLKIYEASVRKFSESSVLNVLFSKNGLYFGDKNNSGIFETELGGTTFDVRIDFEKSDKTESDDKNYADGCTLSYSDAKKLADEFIKKTNQNDYCFKEGRIEKSFSPFYGNWRSGFYVYNYIQYADGFAVETVTSDVDSSVASDMTIKIDNEGIVGLNMFGLDLTEKKVLNGDINSVESAIDIIERNIDDLWLSEYAPIVEIRLEYILNKKEDNSLELVPCWHFCIDQSELKNLDIQTQRENDTNDLCVNAITGEIYRVADRYPVFQTADGLVSMWNK